MNKFKSILVAAGLALAMIFTFSCSADSEAPIPGMFSYADGYSGLLNTDMVFVKAPIPEGSSSFITGVQFIAPDGDIVYGTLIFTSSKELTEMYLQIEGHEGYYTKKLTLADIANQVGSAYAYSVDLDFTQGFVVDGKNITVGGKSTLGEVSESKDADKSVITLYSCDGSKTISGDYAGFIGSFDMGQKSGSFTFQYDTYGVPDEVTVYNGSNARGTPLHHYPSGGTSGWKYVTINLKSSIITVKVIGSSSGTAWDFKVHCPD